jgi:hypothetical protein
MKTAQELILDSESDVHTSNDDISPPQSYSDNEENNRTETGCTWWTDTTQSRPTVPMIHMFTGGLSGLRQNKAPTMNRLFHTGRFHAICLEIMQLLVEETNTYYHQ